MAPVTTDQAVLQRLFTTKSTRDCRQSIIVQSLIIVPLSTMLYLAGVAIYAFYRTQPERLAGLNTPDAVMPFFAIHELPAGVSGLIIASIFAASMAVMSAGINSLTTATVVDFYQRIFRPTKRLGASARRAVGRLGTAAWGLSMTGWPCSPGISASCQSPTPVSSHISGPLFGIFLLAVLDRRATSAGALVGAGAGLGTVSLVSSLTNWSFFYLGPIGLVTTFATGHLASLLTSPPPARKITGLVLGQGEITSLRDR